MSADAHRVRIEKLPIPSPLNPFFAAESGHFRYRLIYSKFVTRVAGPIFKFGFGNSVLRAEFAKLA